MIFNYILKIDFKIFFKYGNNYFKKNYNKNRKNCFKMFLIKSKLIEWLQNKLIYMKKIIIYNIWKNIKNKIFYFLKNKFHCLVIFYINKNYLILKNKNYKYQ